MLSARNINHPYLKPLSENNEEITNYSADTALNVLPQALVSSSHFLSGQQYYDDYYNDDYDYWENEEQTETTDLKRKNYEISTRYSNHKEKQDFSNSENRISNSNNSPSPFFLLLLTVIGVPLLLAAGYWFFVVNGPTPVVRARTFHMSGGDDPVEHQ